MIEDNSIAEPLIAAMSYKSLNRFLKELNRTRRPLQLFSINGAASYTTRSWARQAVIEELKKRSQR